MGLLERMALAIAALFGLLFAFLMGMTYLAYAMGIVGGFWLFVLPILFTIGIVLLQYAISPRIIKWVFKIEWFDPGAAGADERLSRVHLYLLRAASEAGVRTPRLGIVPDDNPNAFTFGWTRNSAFVVLTRGMFKYCDDEEVEAVAAHELGHIVHNDFVVMTVVTTIVLLLYTIARACFEVAKHSKGGGKNNPAAYALIIAAMSYVAYIIANYIALLVSRYREYWADDFSADSTRRPNKLTSALVKVAYGLATEGRGDGRKAQARQENALMLFSPVAARALAAQSATADGAITSEALQQTMAWDLWNPWAFVFELGMTHPLPAKRLLALGRKAKALGQEPYVEFKLVKPESYLDDFLRDVAAKYAWLLSLPLAFAAWWWGWLDLAGAVGLFLAFAGGVGFLYLRLYAYTPGPRDTTVQELLRDPKTGPVKGNPVRLRGRIIGRGVPGLWFSEDLKLDDGTGLLLIDSRTIARVVDVLQGLFATEHFVGQEVEVEGWYRRQVVPLLELRRIQGPGVGRTIRRPYVWMGCAAVLAMLGLAMLAMPMTVGAWGVWPGSDAQARLETRVETVTGYVVEGGEADATVRVEGLDVASVRLSLVWHDEDVRELPQGPLGLLPANRPDVLRLTVTLPDGHVLEDAAASDAGTHVGQLSISLTVPGGTRLEGWAVTVRCDEAGDLTGGMLGQVLRADPGNDWTLEVTLEVMQTITG